MRRPLAILLLALFSFTLGMPAFGAMASADADSNLPACCRRLGKHHCSMAASTSGTALRSARCASFPVPSGPAVVHGAFAAVGSPAFSARATVHTSVISLTQTFGLLLLHGPQHRRGPPVSPSIA